MTPLEQLRSRIRASHADTFAADDSRPFQHRKGPVKLRGMNFVVENPVGSTRRGIGQGGKPWATTMKNAYGRMNRVQGEDGEALDCYFGNDTNAPDVHIVNQQNPKTKVFDEQKAMVFFGSPEKAKAAYLAHYNDPAHFRSMTTMPLETFKRLAHRGVTGSIRWHRKHKRDESTGAIFEADDDKDAVWRTFPSEAGEDGKKHGGSPHLVRGSDGMIMDRREDGTPGKLHGITVKELKGEASPAKESTKAEESVPSSKDREEKTEQKEDPKHVQEQSPESAGPGSDRGRRAEHGGTDGGSDRGVGREAPKQKGRIVTARAELTKPADTSLVPEGLRQHLDEHQQQGVAKAIEAMDKHGGFLNADSTGVGKTRQQLAIAKKYADQGKKVLIVTKSEVIKPDWKKGTISGSFKNDSAAMGVPVTLNNGESPISPGSVHLTTYDRLKDAKDLVDGNTVLLFDESHSLKNSTSARAKHGFEMMRQADKVMYSTATPADKPLHLAHLFRSGVFGGKKAAETYEKLGLVKKEIRTPYGSVSKWEVNPRVGNAEVLRRLSGLQDKMTEEGLMIRREISLDGVDIGIDRIKLPQECHDAMQQIEDNVRATSGANEGLTRALVLMQQRRQQEQYKIPHIVEGVKKEMAEGRKAIIFVSRVNESTVEGEEDDEDSAVTSEGTAKLLREALEKAGVGNIVELHGGVTKGQRQKSMDQFQDGPAQVMVATIESGGTGINLDDSKGDKPRTLFMMTAPFSAVENVQAAGRVHRLKTKSLPRIKYVFGDTDVDDWNSALIAKKMRTLGAAVGGEVGKLDVTAPSGAEHLSGEHKEPFAWHSLTGGHDGALVSAAGGIAPRRIETKYGVRHVHSFKPDEATAKLLNSASKPKWLTANEYNGKREATVWGDTPEQVVERVTQLKSGSVPEQAKPESPPAPIAPPPLDRLGRIAAAMTPEHQSSVHSGIRHLASMDDDRARELNGMGFNKMDSELGAKLAETMELTPRQAAAAASMLGKYKKQLPPQIHEHVSDLMKRANEQEEAEAKQAVAAPPAPVDPNVRIRGNTFPHKEDLKRLGFRWDGDRKVWYRARAGFDPSRLPRGLSHYSAEVDGASFVCVDDLPMTAMDRLRQRIQFAAESYDPAKHPRGEHGRWTKIGGADVRLHDTEDKIVEGPAHLIGKTHDEAKAHMAHLMKKANTEQMAMIGKYGQKKGATPDKVAPEWIGKHAQAFRQDFIRRHEASGDPEPLNEEKFLYEAARAGFDVPMTMSQLKYRMARRKNPDAFEADAGPMFDGEKKYDHVEGGDWKWKTIGAKSHHGGHRALVNDKTGMIGSGVFDGMHVDDVHDPKKVKAHTVKKRHELLLLEPLKKKSAEDMVDDAASGERAPNALSHEDAADIFFPKGSEHEQAPESNLPPKLPTPAAKAAPASAQPRQAGPPAQPRRPFADTLNATRAAMKARAEGRPAPTQRAAAPSTLTPPPLPPRPTAAMPTQPPPQQGGLREFARGFVKGALPWTGQHSPAAGSTPPPLPPPVPQQQAQSPNQASPAAPTLQPPRPSFADQWAKTKAARAAAARNPLPFTPPPGSVPPPNWRDQQNGPTEQEQPAEPVQEPAAPSEPKPIDIQDELQQALKTGQLSIPLPPNTPMSPELQRAYKWIGIHKGINIGDFQTDAQGNAVATVSQGEKPDRHVPLPDSWNDEPGVEATPMGEGRGQSEMDKMRAELAAGNAEQPQAEAAPNPEDHLLHDLQTGKPIAPPVVEPEPAPAAAQQPMQAPQGGMMPAQAGQQQDAGGLQAEEPVSVGGVPGSTMAGQPGAEAIPAPPAPVSPPDIRDIPQTGNSVADLHHHALQAIRDIVNHPAHHPQAAAPAEPEPAPAVETPQPVEADKPVSKLSEKSPSPVAPAAPPVVPPKAPRVAAAQQPDQPKRPTAEEFRKRMQEHIAKNPNDARHKAYDKAVSELGLPPGAEHAKPADVKPSRNEPEPVTTPRKPAPSTAPAAQRASALKTKDAIAARKAAEQQAAPIAPPPRKAPDVSPSPSVPDQAAPAPAPVDVAGAGPAEQPAAPAERQADDGSTAAEEVGGLPPALSSTIMSKAPPLVTPKKSLDLGDGWNAELTGGDGNHVRYEVRHAGANPLTSYGHFDYIRTESGIWRPSPGAGIELHDRPIGMTGKGPKNARGNGLGEKFIKSAAEHLGPIASTSATDETHTSPSAQKMWRRLEGSGAKIEHLSGESSPIADPGQAWVYRHPGSTPEPAPSPEPSHAPAVSSPAEAPPQEPAAPEPAPQPAETSVASATGEVNPERSKLEADRQSYRDAIGMKRDQGKPVPQEWLNAAADLDQKLKGEQPTGGHASNEVFGHPMATSLSPEKYGNLIPIRGGDKATIERRMKEAQKHSSDLGEKIGRADAIAKGRMKATPAQVKEAKAYLTSHAHTEDSTARDLLNKETIPELNRLHKLAPDAQPAAQGVEQQGKQPHEMTRDEYIREQMRKDKAPDKAFDHYARMEQDTLNERDKVAAALKDPAKIKAQTRIGESEDQARKSMQDTVDWHNENLNRFGHRTKIEQAIAQGKPVPAEVLKDYPDLASQQAPPAGAVDRDALMKQADAALASGDEATWDKIHKQIDTADGHPTSHSPEAEAEPKPTPAHRQDFRKTMPKLTGDAAHRFMETKYRREDGTVSNGYDYVEGLLKNGGQIVNQPINTKITPKRESELRGDLGMMYKKASNDKAYRDSIMPQIEKLKSQLESGYESVPQQFLKTSDGQLVQLNKNESKYAKFLADRPAATAAAPQKEAHETTKGDWLAQNPESPRNKNVKNAAEKLFAAAKAKGFEEGGHEIPRLTPDEAKRALKGTGLDVTDFKHGLEGYARLRDGSGDNHGQLVLSRQLSPAEQGHAENVHAAHAAGNKIPDDVLKDYPHLASAPEEQKPKLTKQQQFEQRRQSAASEKQKPIHPTKAAADLNALHGKVQAGQAKPEELTKAIAGHESPVLAHIHDKRTATPGNARVIEQELRKRYKGLASDVQAKTSFPQWKKQQRANHVEAHAEDVAHDAALPAPKPFQPAERAADENEWGEKLHGGPGFRPDVAVGLAPQAAGTPKEPGPEGLKKRMRKAKGIPEPTAPTEETPADQAYARAQEAHGKGDTEGFAKHLSEAEKHAQAEDAGPQKPGRKRKPPKQDDIRQQIHEAYKAQGGGVPSDVHQFAESLPNAFTFKKGGQREGEVRQQVGGKEGVGIARSGSVNFTDDPRSAGGEDALGAFRDKYGKNGEDLYWKLARERAGIGWQDALGHARKSQDPGLNFLAAVHDAGPQGSGKNIEQVQPDDLQLDETGTVRGHPVRVTENEDGEKVIKDGSVLPETPVAALRGPVPFDKGSRKQEELSGEKTAAEPWDEPASPAPSEEAPPERDYAKIQGIQNRVHGPGHEAGEAARKEALKNHPPFVHDPSKGLSPKDQESIHNIAKGQKSQQAYQKARANVESNAIAGLTPEEREQAGFPHPPKPPQEVRASKQLGMFNRDEKGQHQEIGGLTGTQQGLFAPAHEPVKADEPKRDLIGGANINDPKHTAPLPFSPEAKRPKEQPTHADMPLHIRNAVNATRSADAELKAYEQLYGNRADAENKYRVLHGGLPHEQESLGSARSLTDDAKQHAGKKGWDWKGVEDAAAKHGGLSEEGLTPEAKKRVDAERVQHERLNEKQKRGNEVSAGIQKMADENKIERDRRAKAEVPGEMQGNSNRANTAHANGMTNAAERESAKAEANGRFGDHNKAAKAHREAAGAHHAASRAATGSAREEHAERAALHLAKAEEHKAKSPETSPSTPSHSERVSEIPHQLLKRYAEMTPERQAKMRAAFEHHGDDAGLHAAIMKAHKALPDSNFSADSTSGISRLKYRIQRSRELSFA